MKALMSLLVISALFFCACAPHGSSGHQDRQQDNAGSGNNRDGQEPTGQSDCGAVEIKSCHIFGLTPEELMLVRRGMPSVMNTNYDHHGLNTEQMAMIRSAQVVQWIQKQYKDVPVDLEDGDFKNIEDFYNSIQWNKGN